MRLRVARSRDLVAEGHSPSVAARVARISRHALSGCRALGGSRSGGCSRIRSRPRSSRSPRPIRPTAIDCCTREIVAWQLELRCRADEAIAVVEQAAATHGIQAGGLTPRKRQRLRLHCETLQGEARRARHPPPPRRLPRPRVAGLHRELVRETQRTGGVAERVRDPRRRETRHPRLRRPLPPPTALEPRLPHAARGAPDLCGSARTSMNRHFETPQADAGRVHVL